MIKWLTYLLDYKEDKKQCILQTVHVHHAVCHMISKSEYKRQSLYCIVLYLQWMLRAESAVPITSVVMLIGNSAWACMRNPVDRFQLMSGHVSFNNITNVLH
jgi:hypothetical protein